MEMCIRTLSVMFPESPFNSYGPSILVVIKNYVGSLSFLYNAFSPVTDDDDCN